MKIINPIQALCFIAALFALQGLHADDLEAFPKAGDGMVRHVLRLPEKKDESAFKVELIAGKTVMVDDVNRYWFAGKIEEVVIEGWGYSRYVIEKIGPMAGTLVAVDPDTAKVEKFVTLGGDPSLIRYNSRLPIVVYVPEGVEVRYKIWTAEPEAKVIEKG